MSDTVDVEDTVADDFSREPSKDDQPKLLGVGAVLLSLAAVLGLVGGILAFVIRLPLFALEPGNTFQTESFIEIEGADSFMSPGEVSFVTVTQRRLSPIDWVVSSLQSSDEIFHEDELLQGRTLDEQREENALLMITSQNDAIAAALNHLGFETAEPAGAVIVDVIEGGVLDGVLARNDVITEVDGTPITSDLELFDALDAVEAGQTVTLLAGRPLEDPREIEVELTDDTSGFIGIVRDQGEEDDGAGATISSVLEDGPSADFLLAGDRIVSLDGEAVESFEALVELLVGRRANEQVQIEATRVVDGQEELVVDTVTLGARTLERAGLQQVATQFRDAELPFDVGFTTEDIGGPSAGLAFTVTVLDVLTDGDLTGGANIVVTGAIQRDGRVTPVGGVRQKAYAALEDDADIFIVPEANLAEARETGVDLRIESVTTLGEALDLIAEFGGNVGELPTNGEL